MIVPYEDCHLVSWSFQCYREWNVYEFLNNPVPYSEGVIIWCSCSPVTKLLWPVIAQLSYASTLQLMMVVHAHDQLHNQMPGWYQMCNKTLVM